MKKIGAFIPIRLASERLPDKAIKEIWDKPIVYHLLDQVCATRHIQKENVIVCTTEDSSDDRLVELVEAYGAKIFRGEKDDIIKRFYDANQQFNFDIILQVDGDDILVDPFYMGLTIQKLLEDETLDIVTCEGLPLGIAAKSFTKSSLEKVYHSYQTTFNDTGFIYFFTKTGLCKQHVIFPLTDTHQFNEARLTLDYPEDFTVFNHIISALYKSEQSIDVESIIQYLKANPDIVKINQFLEIQYWQRTKEKAKLQYLNSAGALEDI